MTPSRVVRRIVLCGCTVALLVSGSRAADEVERVVPSVPTARKALAAARADVARLRGTMTRKVNALEAKLRAMPAYREALAARDRAKAARDAAPPEKADMIEPVGTKVGATETRDAALQAAEATLADLRSKHIDRVLEKDAEYTRTRMILASAEIRLDAADGDLKRARAAVGEEPVTAADDDFTDPGTPDVPLMPLVGKNGTWLQIDRNSGPDRRPICLSGDNCGPATRSLQSVVDRAKKNRAR